MNRTPLAAMHHLPDADAVRRAFLASGRRHLILTGGRGVGKSTLLSSLTAGKGYPGITTAAQPGIAVTMTDNRTGREAVVGIYDPNLPGTERKMRPTPDGFDRFGRELLVRCAASEEDFVTLDEIGYLERDCRAYLSALEELLAKKRVMAVVRREAMPHLQALLRREDVFAVDLDRPFGNAGCVIMASGMGVRFGGNKLMADFGGAPMLARALDATDSIFARRVVVTRHADVAQYCENRGIAVVLHDLPGRNDTVRLGLAAVGDVSFCMFCPGDQPLLGRATVMALALAAANDENAIYRAAYADTVGAPAIFGARYFDALRSLPPGKGGGYVMKQYPQLVRGVQTASCEELWDADTKERLAALFSRHLQHQNEKSGCDT